MSVPKIVVHTDVFLDHLAGDRHPSVLRRALSEFFCYTTVYQAVELFALARSEKETKAVEDSMAAVKVLGMNPKNARAYGAMLAGAGKLKPWNILIAGLCVESRLPLLTARRRDFRGLDHLVVVPPSLMQSGISGADILRKAKSGRFVQERK